MYVVVGPGIEDNVDAPEIEVIISAPEIEGEVR